MTSIINIDTTAASLATLRAALKGADAYNGVARFSREAMAEYARKVQILRADGETVAISRDTVDALMEAPAAQPEPAAAVVAEPVAAVVAEPAPQPEPEVVAEPAAAPAEVAVVAEPAAEVVAEPAVDVAALLAQVEQAVAEKTARPAPKLGKKFPALFVQLLAVAEEQEDGSLVATADHIKEAGWSTSYTTMRNGWSAKKPGGLAAIAQGYSTSTRKDGDSFVVVITAA